ncbi:MAG: patatin-like phospholipase family protein [Rikenellaceae bacterium]|nr:patatin-like phospholipase family protein [Rikenellaceae bacterium]MCL2693274.1 patatin-like phospholipase family protein [Rikenellaceae bacterium]
MKNAIIIAALVIAAALTPTVAQQPVCRDGCDDCVGRAAASDGLELVRERARAEGRKTVGLVLSGGGAKGVAHISAIRALEEAGIPIDFIAGTSMGAIVGGLYAIGYRIDALDSMVRTQHWDALIYDLVSRRDLSLGAREQDDKYLVRVEIGPGNKVRLPSGIIGGRNIYNLLYELTFGYHDPTDFYRLPIPFACVGYDMVEGRSVTLCHGLLADCIRASMSIPGAFQTVTMDDMILVDGGIGNNFPADLVRAMGAEVVIGIDVTAPMRTREQINDLADILDQLMSITAREAYDANLRLVDLLIHPDITGYTAASFDPASIDTMLRRGAEAMRESWDEIIALRERIGLRPDYVPLRCEAAVINPSIHVGAVRFEGVHSESERALRRIVGIRENTTVTGDDLRRAVTRLTGTHSLKNVQYRFEKDSVRTTVVFSVTETHRNALSVGFRFDTEEMAAILLHLSYAGGRMTNTHFALTGRLGMNPRGTLAFVYGNETQRKFNASFSFGTNEINLFRRGTKISGIDFDQSTVSVSLSNIRMRNFRASVGARLDYYHFRSVISLYGANDRRAMSEALVSYVGLMQYETLDSRYYPRRGVSAMADYTLSTTNFVQYRGAPPFSAVQAEWLGAFSPTRRTTFIPAVFGRALMGHNIAFLHNNFMGGALSGRYVPQQFAFLGIRGIEQFGRSIVGARLETRVQIWSRTYISLLADYARLGDNFLDLPTAGSNLFGLGAKYSYNSFLGPIDVLLDYSPHDKKVGFYLSLGYYF